MFTHTRFTRLSTPDVLAETNDSVAGDGEAAFDGTVATSTTQEILVGFGHDALKSFAVYSSGAVTIKTNSSGAPDNTLNCPAGLTIWNTNDIAANPFTADVTKLYAVNGSATNALTLKIRVLYDASV